MTLEKKAKEMLTRPHKAMEAHHHARKQDQTCSQMHLAAQPKAAALLC